VRHGVRRWYAFHVPDFEVFKRNRSPAIKPPAVTVLHRGQLSMNEAAFTELGSPKAVELLYSPAEQLVGIRAADPAEPHAYVPRTAAKNKGHGPYIVSGAAFFSHYGIIMDKTVRFDVTVNDGILIIDLKQPGVLIGRGSGGEASGT
jgi:hypothetical protein